MLLLNLLLCFQRQTLVKFDGKEGPQNYSTAVAEYFTNSYVSALIGVHSVA